MATAVICIIPSLVNLGIRSSLAMMMTVLIFRFFCFFTPRPGANKCSYNSPCPRHLLVVTPITAQPTAPILPSSVKFINFIEEVLLLVLQLVYNTYCVLFYFCESFPYEDEVSNHWLAVISVWFCSIAFPTTWNTFISGTTVGPIQSPAPGLSIFTKIAAHSAVLSYQSCCEPWKVSLLSAFQKRS